MIEKARSKAGLYRLDQIAYMPVPPLSFVYDYREYQEMRTGGRPPQIDKMKTPNPLFKYPYGCDYKIVLAEKIS